MKKFVKKIVLCGALLGGFAWASPLVVSWANSVDYKIIQGRILFVKSLENGVKLTNLRLFTDTNECDWEPMGGWKTSLNKGEFTSVHFFCQLKKVVVDSNKGQFSYNIILK